MSEIPSLSEERGRLREVDRARRSGAVRPGRYNTARPGDEAFALLPLDVQVERTLRVKLAAIKKIEKCDRTMERIRRDAKKKGVRVTYSVNEGKVVDVSVMADREMGGAAAGE